MMETNKERITQPPGRKYKVKIINNSPNPPQNHKVLGTVQKGNQTFKIIDFPIIKYPKKMSRKNNLRNKKSTTWPEQSGQCGYVTGKVSTTKTIFLPGAGHKIGQNDQLHQTLAMNKVLPRGLIPDAQLDEDHGNDTVHMLLTKTGKEQQYNIVRPFVTWSKTVHNS